MALPTLTPEQREQALKKAAEARKKRAEVKGELKSGKRSLADVLKRADNDDTLGKMNGNRSDRCVFHESNWAWRNGGDERRRARLPDLQFSRVQSWIKGDQRRNKL